MTHVLAKELREAVLQAAMSGKLTEHLSTDTPVEETLKQIAKEKDRLIKEKKIKKEKPLPEIEEDEVPFDIPDNWNWLNLGDVFIVRSSSRVHQSDWKTEGIPFYRAREVVKLSQTGKVDNELFIDEDLYEKYSKTSGVPRAGDLLVSGVGTLGATYIVQEHEKFYYKDASVLCFENWFNQNPIFTKSLLETPYVIEQIYDQSAFGTTVATLTIRRASQIKIALPPIEEQARIVAKVDELMAKIDEYEQLENQLVHLKEQFPKDMKDSLLQAGMMGKLTERLITDSGLEVEEESVSDSYDSFDIPDEWQWNTIGSVMSVTTGLTYNKLDQCSASNNALRVLRGGNILDNYKYDLFDNDVFVTYRDKYIRLQKDDVITPSVTSLEKICKVALIDRELPNTTAGGFVYILRPNNNNVLNPKYMMYYFSTAINKRNCKENIHKSGQAFYNLTLFLKI